MQWIISFKDTASNVFAFFSNVLKEHLKTVIIIIAAYAVVDFALYQALKFAFKTDTPAFFGLLSTLLKFSFMSAVLSVVDGEDFKFKRVFPSIKMILFSVILWGLLFFSLQPTRLFVMVTANLLLPEKLAFITSFNISILALFFNFVTAALAVFVLFAVFGFLEQPKLDQPILNSWEIFKNNKLFIALISFFAALLYTLFPVLAENAFSFAVQAVLCVFFMTVYFALRPKPENENGADNDQSAANAPKMRISI